MSDFFSAHAHSIYMIAGMLLLLVAKIPFVEHDVLLEIVVKMLGFGTNLLDPGKDQDQVDSQKTSIETKLNGGVK